MSDDIYWSSIDLFPLETEEHNRIYPFYDHLKQGRLTTTRCKACSAQAWPPRVVCPVCVSDDLEWIDLPTEGILDTFTVEEIGVPLGFENPLVHGLVKIDENLTLFSRIVDVRPEELEEGMSLVLQVIPIDRDRVIYAFKPKD